ncbi:MAG TPA: pyridoxamine 5'-phosphate oxidase family protein [Syntrophorhabdaceae bacterium]|jgi:hypothetical protein
MNTADIEKSVLLARRIGHLFVATANDKGEPHVAVAGLLDYRGGSRIGVSAWFCPDTLANLQMNGRISVVVWDKEGDTGYQLIGKSEKIESIAMMDGYSPSAREAEALPQVERLVTVKVNKVIDFLRTLHSDREK